MTSFPTSRRRPASRRCGSTRKRGRIDPCGSSVIKDLKWDTTGGTGVRELGLFADFKVTFTMEVKKFPTQFKPGSTECLPK